MYMYMYIYIYQQHSTGVATLLAGMRERERETACDGFFSLFSLKRAPTSIAYAELQSKRKEKSHSG